MAKITKIKPQKRKNRFNVYLDGKFAFGLPVETLVKAGLAVGQELSEKEIENLIFKNEFQKLLDKTLRLISLRPRSEKEIRNYLKKNLPSQHATASLVGRILKRLKREKLIDDHAFVVWWLEQRATFRPRGKFGLRTELRRKGIDQEIIKKALEGVNEMELAQRVAQKKLKSYRKLSSCQFRRKMSAFLARRGFSWSIIKSVIDQLGKKR